MTTTAKLSMYLSYRDAVAALRWLEKAFGFETTMEAPDGDGGIAHSELRYGDVTLIVFSDREGYDRPARKGETSGSGRYIAFDTQDEVDAIYTSATAVGAETIWAPEMTEWGNYRCRVVDPEGYEWGFGTHQPGRPTD